jgi:hypothetical protein
MAQITVSFAVKIKYKSMICAGNIFDYYNLRHFKEIKYFSRDGRTMPNGIGFQRGNFIKECADNANSFVLSEVVFSGQKSPNGKCYGVIILPVNTNNNLNDDTITQSIATISQAYSIGNAFRGRYIGVYDEIYDKNSITIEVNGLSRGGLYRVATSVARTLHQKAIIVKDLNSNKIYRYKL